MKIQADIRKNTLKNVGSDFHGRGAHLDLFDRLEAQGGNAHQGLAKDKREGKGREFQYAKNQKDYFRKKNKHGKA